MSLRAAVEQILLAIPGVQPGGNAFSAGDACWVDAKQVAHFTATGDLELRLTRGLIRTHRRRLAADPCIELRASTASDWLTIRLGDDAALDRVRELAPLAVAAHRPPDGSPGLPPPSGAALERRRRFH